MTSPSAGARYVQAFAGGDHADLPFGPSSVSLHIPDRMRAELEVEVEGDQVEVEVEFKWSMVEHHAAAAAPVAVKAQQGRGAGKRAPGSKARKR